MSFVAWGDGMMMNMMTHGMTADMRNLAENA
jgi:hypothetical protein